MKITLNDKEYYLRFPNKALKQIQRDAEFDIFSDKEVDFDKLEDCAYIIAYYGILYGCKYEEKELDLSISQVESLLDLENSLAVTNAFFEQLNKAFEFLNKNSSEKKD